MGLARNIHRSIIAVVLLVPLMLGQGCGLFQTDSDGDGFSDETEVRNTPATDPNDPTDNPDNVRDSDGDGCSDYEELNIEGSCDNDPFTPAEPVETNVSISGRVAVAASMLVDSDTLDPNNLFVDNDDLGEVQPAPNPCSIGGYLGQTATKIDISDVYLVQMAAGQTATLLLADMDVNDFDLFLYDNNGDPLDSSEGVGRAEQITAPSNGTFLVQVYGYSIEDSQQLDTGGLYSLIIGEDQEISIADDLPRTPLSSLDAFVEGDVLVKVEPTADKRQKLARAVTIGPMERVDPGLNALGLQRYRVTTDGAVSQSAKADRLHKSHSGLRRPSSATVAAIKQLRRQGDVVYAEPNYIRRVQIEPNDEFYTYQWNFRQIGLTDAWDVTLGSEDVIVAVVDTGVVLNHPDMKNKLVAGYDFISDPEVSLDGDGLDANPDDPGDSDEAGVPSSFHGTHVAGIISAASNNAIGVSGVSWESMIMPLRALGKGGGTDYDIAQAVLYAAGLSNDSGRVPAVRADIINMSVGGVGFSQPEQDAITAARNRGVIVVTASGNRGQNGDNDSPGGLDGVFNVSSVGYERQRAPYSNFGNSVKVSAPGGNMLLDANGDGFSDGILSATGLRNGVGHYEFYEGTSMAAPHVSGVVALMLAVNPDLTPDDLDLLLSGTHPGTGIRITEDLGSPGWDQVYGHGLINALSAVRAALEVTDTPPSQVPALRVTPKDLNFGSSENNLALTAENGGGGTMVISAVVVSDSWIVVREAGAEVNRSVYNVSVNRDGLSEGAYSGDILLVSNGGNVTIPVRMRVGQEPSSGGDVGMLYVLLVRPDTLTGVAQANITKSNNYSFTMNDIPEGQYLLFAGTDMDNNLVIDNDGEAFGGYPVLSRYERLSATTDLTALSFAVSYIVNVQATQSGDSPRVRLEPVGIRRME